MTRYELNSKLDTIYDQLIALNRADPADMYGPTVVERRRVLQGQQQQVLFDLKRLDLDGRP